MQIRIDAANRKAGMTIGELTAAIGEARKTGCTEIKRAVIGMRGQLQAIEFTNNKNILSGNAGQ